MNELRECKNTLQIFIAVAGEVGPADDNTTIVVVANDDNASDDEKRNDDNDNDDNDDGMALDATAQRSARLRRHKSLVHASRAAVVVEQWLWDW